MDKKSKALIVIFVLIVIAAIAAAFHRYVILGDISYESDEAAFQEALLEE